jgi:glycosyltransferase involved in cell wall biosynthesis
MMKILYVCNTADWGGASKTLITLLRHISRSQVAPMVVVPAEGPLLLEVRKLSIECEVIPIPHWFRPAEDLSLRLGLGITGAGFMEPLDLARQESTVFLDQCQQWLEQRLRSLLTIISENAIDLVHTTGISILEGAIAARLAGKKHVWHIHEYLSNHPGLSPFLPLGPATWLIDNLTDCAVVPSVALKKACETIISCDKLYHVYNGVEIIARTEASGVARQEYRSRMAKEFNILDTDHVICSVGHPGPEKGWPDLVRTAHLLRQKRTDFRIIVVGNYSSQGESFRELVSLVKDLRVSDRIIFAGYRRDAQDIIAASDIVFQPSRMETFSLVAAEAMALSVPVVGTTCGGMEEVVVHGESGFVTNPWDHHSMAESLGILMDDGDARERMGRCGRQVFLDRFSPELYAKNFTTIYQEMLNNGSPSCSSVSPIPPEAYKALAGLSCSTYSLGLLSQLLRNENGSAKFLAKSLVDLISRRIRGLWARHLRMT